MIKIRVLDKQTNQPVPFVNVRLENESYVFVDDTNNRGWAELEGVPDGKYTLKIRSPDHRPYTERYYLSQHSILMNIKLQSAID